MQREKVAALAAVLVWLYVLLAVLTNPAYTPPNIPANPVMPFLLANIVNLLWPVVLISSPLVLLAGQRLVQASGAGGRQVSARDQARIQARARATRELIKEEISRPETRRSRTSTRESSPAKNEEQAIVLPKQAEQKTTSGEPQPRPTGEEVEFTPPPVAPRADQKSVGVTPPDTDRRQVDESALEETKAEVKEETSAAKRVDELEAARAAAASLMDRLEEMKQAGAIQPELYDKLKKKYVTELEKINAKMKKLPVGKE